MQLDLTDTGPFSKEESCDTGPLEQNLESARKAIHCLTALQVGFLANSVHLCEICCDLVIFDIVLISLLFQLGI